MKKISVTSMLLWIAIAGCASTSAGAPSVDAVNAALDAFHQAASEANEDRYFDLIAEDGVFIGTDATERWTKDDFRAFAHPHFSTGKGWTFATRNRNVAFSRDGSVAWFDELLDSASYGECRGTGVLQKTAGEWRVEQYHLTIPIPNDLAAEVVGRIRGQRNSQ